MVQLLCLKRLLADGIRPDLVLVEFHPESLYDYYNTYAGKHFLAEDRLQFQDLGVLRRYDPSWPRAQPKWLSQQCLPWHFHRKEMEKTCLLEWISPEKRGNIWNVTDRHGWEGAICERAGYKTGLPPADQVRSVAHQLTMLQHLEVDNRFVRAYQELLATCQGEHIPAVLVRLPQYSTMREQTPAVLQARHDACLLQLRETNVPCIDARAWVPDELFLDGFHLLIPGSVTFSQRLEREFLIPLLTQPGSLAQLSATNASLRR